MEHIKIINDETLENPLEERPQYLIVAEGIKNSILMGKFKLGDKLPSEREMAKHFNVGRPTIREAVRSLEISGLLETKRGNGTFITNHTQMVMSDHLQLISSLNNVSVREIIEYREMFETKTVALAATHREEDELPELYACLEGIQRAKNYDEVREADFRFHESIAKMAHNILISENFAAMNHFFEDSINNSATEIPNFGETYKDIAHYHLPIYESIRDQDPEVAMLFMRRHMDRIWHFHETKQLSKNTIRE
ncbi:FadR family transcriptional regulator [Peptoniphilus sp. KCTC 25270]|uniref:FadR/GntR family transcriptional regulator n=1 Tax=Peptoniphilus sp. KCTC 25270 TaxID=2897414 RepID=UPI001E450C65|nr:FadR/GntR family transcriptional regulator [Peptoniphilus sp. KCTC 25270]MCD1147440.1 FadR family transcriptional regulator [Peptoniphilus sp. KCTC 25270]